MPIDIDQMRWTIHFGLPGSMLNVNQCQSTSIKIGINGGRSNILNTYWNALRRFDRYLLALMLFLLINIRISNGNWYWLELIGIYPGPPITCIIPESLHLLKWSMYISRTNTWLQQTIKQLLLKVTPLFKHWRSYQANPNKLLHVRGPHKPLHDICGSTCLGCHSYSWNLFKCSNAATEMWFMRVLCPINGKLHSS